jgi:hypothetical protein
MASKKKTPVKKKKKAERRQLGKNTIVHFMGALVQAGYIGEEIPESSGEQGRIAMRIRQMAEKLARNTLKHGEEDTTLGGE